MPRGRGRRRRGGGHARPGRAARPAAGGARGDRRPAAPPAPAPARPADHRGDRPLVGGRDPLDRAALAVPARAPTSTRRRVGRLHAACGDVLGAALDHYEEVIGATVPDKLPMPLKVHRRAGRGLPALRHATRGDPLQGLRDELLPRGADRRPRAEGPAAVEAAQVAADAYRSPAAATLGDSFESFFDAVDEFVSNLAVGPPGAAAPGLRVLHRLPDASRARRATTSCAPPTRTRASASSTSGAPTSRATASTP